MIKNYFAFLFFLAGSLLQAQASTPVKIMRCGTTIESLLKVWRSSDRFIPGGILRQQAETHVPADVRRALVDCTADELLRAMKIDFEAYKIDKGVAENVLKIRRITELCMQGECPFEKDAEHPIARHEDRIVGFPAGAELNDLLAFFPEPSAATFVPGAYELRRDLLEQTSVSHASANDHYAFTFPGIAFSLNFHEKYRAVFELVSRGADAWPFMISFGQDQVVDMLEHLHFDEWEVQAIKRRAEAKFKLPEAFYDWLRTWRFKGDVRGLKPGTVSFANLPAMYVSTDPASALIVESKINPMMSSYTKWMTNVIRIVMAKGGIKSLQEAGTRRVITGTLSAITSLYAGVDGTSNVFAAELLGKPSYGTTSHSGMMMFFPDEFEGFESILEHVIGEALMLPDTYNIMDGIRRAVKAGGGKRVSMVRQDSNAFDDSGSALTTEETVMEIFHLWEDLNRKGNAHAVTNDQNEKSLQALNAEVGDKVTVTSVGGAIASGSGPTHGNFVYKLVQLNELAAGTKIRDGKFIKTIYPVKVANGAKSTEPGEKDVYRFFDADGQMSRDLKVLAGQPAPEGGVPLMVSLMKDGRRDLPRANPTSSGPEIFAQLAKLPPAMLDLKATRSGLKAAGKLYPVESSKGLSDIREDAIAATIPPEEFRTLIIFGSFDPITDAHIKMAYNLSELNRDQSNPKGYDRVIFVPARDEPVHGKDYRLKGRTRISVMEQKLAVQRRQFEAVLAARQSPLAHPLPEFEIWDGEINYTGEKPPYSFDTLQAIQRKFPDAKMTIAMGEDTFFSIGRKSAPWKDDRALLEDYDWMVLSRPALSELPQVVQDRADTLTLINDFRKREFSWTSPHNHKIRFYDAKLSDISSTEIRAFYDKQGIAARAHITDPQETFMKRSKRPIPGYTEDGALAVDGTEKTVEPITAVASASRSIHTFLTTTSGDAHSKEEAIFPHLNKGEFHDMKFPMHGDIEQSGPAGDAFIPELASIIPEADQVRVPSKRLKWVGERPEWETVPFKLIELGATLTDPAKVLRFEKQGEASYNVFTNEHYLEYLNTIDPYRMLPHFHDAWCTDFCFFTSVKGELERGFRAFIIIDAIAGVFPRRSADRIRELDALGAQFMTSADYVALTKKWAIEQTTKPVSWSDVLNDLSNWQATKGFKTREWLYSKLGRFIPLNPGEEESPGATVFQKTGRRLPPEEAIGGASCERAVAGD